LLPTGPAWNTRRERRRQLALGSHGAVRPSYGYDDGVVAALGDPDLKRIDDLCDQALGVLAIVANLERGVEAPSDHLADQASNGERLSEIRGIAAFEPLHAHGSRHDDPFTAGGRREGEVAATPLPPKAQRYNSTAVRATFPADPARLR